MPPAANKKPPANLISPVKSEGAPAPSDPDTPQLRALKRQRAVFRISSSEEEEEPKPKPKPKHKPKPKPMYTLVAQVFGPDVYNN